MSLDFALFNARLSPSDPSLSCDNVSAVVFSKNSRLSGLACMYKVVSSAADNNSDC